MPLLFNDIAKQVEEERKEKSDYSAQSVGWGSEFSQKIRYETILTHTRFDSIPYDYPRILEIGCGYGALVDELIKRYSWIYFKYFGVDINMSLIKLAKLKYGSVKGFLKFRNRMLMPQEIKREKINCVIASGITCYKGILDNAAGKTRIFEFIRTWPKVKITAFNFLLWDKKGGFLTYTIDEMNEFILTLEGITSYRFVLGYLPNDCTVILERDKE